MPHRYIVALWAWLVFSAGWAGFFAPTSVKTPAISPELTPLFLVLPAALLASLGFFTRHSPFYVPAAVRWVDQQAGRGAYEKFLVACKPMLMFAAAGAAWSIVAFLRAAALDTAHDMRALSALYFSASAGFAIAHLLLEEKGAVGV